MNLKCFLYLLLRDELAAGKVERLLMESERASATGKIEYSNELLSAYATELAARLLAK